jgi:hypothetical protein
MQHHPHQQPPDFLKTIMGDTASLTREALLAEGTLIDVTEQAKRFNYPCPVAISKTLFESCVQWDRFDSECQAYQDQDIRLSFVLTAARAAMKQSGFNKTDASFVLAVLPRDGFSLKKIPKRLKVILDKDGSNQPVLTILVVGDLYQSLLDFNRPEKTYFGGVAK